MQHALPARQIAEALAPEGGTDWTGRPPAHPPCRLAPPCPCTGGTGVMVPDAPAGQHPPGCTACRQRAAGADSNPSPPPQPRAAPAAASSPKVDHAVRRSKGRAARPGFLDAVAKKVLLPVHHEPGVPHPLHLRPAGAAVSPVSCMVHAHTMAGACINEHRTGGCAHAPNEHMRMHHLLPQQHGRELRGQASRQIIHVQLHLHDCCCGARRRAGHAEREVDYSGLTGKATWSVDSSCMHLAANQRRAQVGRWCARQAVASRVISKSERHFVPKP